MIGRSRVGDRSGDCRKIGAEQAFQNADRDHADNDKSEGSGALSQTCLLVPPVQEPERRAQRSAHDQRGLMAQRSDEKDGRREEVPAAQGRQQRPCGETAGQRIEQRDVRAPEAEERRGDQQHKGKPEREIPIVFVDPRDDQRQRNKQPGGAHQAEDVRNQRRRAMIEQGEDRRRQPTSDEATVQVIGGGDIPVRKRIDQLIGWNMKSEQVLKGLVIADDDRRHQK